MGHCGGYVLGEYWELCKTDDSACAPQANNTYMLIKNTVTIWSSNSTTRYVPKEKENANLERCMHLYVYFSIIYNTQDREATQVSIKRWTHTEVAYAYIIHMHTWWNISHIEGWDLIICNMDGLRGYYAKCNKSEKINTVWFHLHVQSKTQKRWRKQKAETES